MKIFLKKNLQLVENVFFTLKNTIVVVIVLVCGLTIRAQQPSLYTMYMHNPYGVHPAYAGKESKLIATGIIRQQWNGLAGAPSTQQINAHLPFNIINSGFGINIENDKTGVAQTLSAAVTYAYHIRMNKKSNLSIGVNAGYLQQNMNGNDIRTPNGNYQNAAVDHKDKLFGAPDNWSGQAPIFDASIFFQQNNIKIGFTAKNLIGQTIYYAINSYKIRLIKNYLFTFATDLEIGSNFLLKPSLLLRSQGNQIQSEVSLTSDINQKISLGASYRGFNQNTVDALGLIGGIKLNEAYTLYYSYDMTLSSLRAYNSGSHELLFRYTFGKEIGKARPEKIIYNPRYY